jgi:phosphatidylserine/phosphatidylglycerophosphate/cardiolipin synthase-like enzyme
VVFFAYAFTSQDLAQALEGAAAGGIRVRGVLEASQPVDPASVYSKLRQAGIEVLLDGNPANMHHEFMEIDGEIAISGPQNFSRSAELCNDEYVLIIHDPGVAGDLQQEFEQFAALAAP